MHDNVKALKKENNELRKKIASLEQSESDIIANHKFQLETEMKEHMDNKKEFKDEIAVTKV